MAINVLLELNDLTVTLIRQLNEVRSELDKKSEEVSKLRSNVIKLMIESDSLSKELKSSLATKDKELAAKDKEISKKTSRILKLELELGANNLEVNRIKLLAKEKDSKLKSVTKELDFLKQSQPSAASGHNSTKETSNDLNNLVNCPKRKLSTTDFDEQCT